MDFQIIHQDAALILVNKPSGLPVYPLAKSTSLTVADLLQEKFPELRHVGPERQAGLIHRLDNGTSGLLLACRTEEAYQKLRSIWNTPLVSKTYTALVLGSASLTGTLEDPISHHPRNQKKMMVCETGKKAQENKARPAHTEWKKVKTYGKALSLLEVRITTGVRHQIRVHLASVGHPLAGDKLYQNPQKRKLDRTGLARPFLHLSKLELPHPQSGERINFFCPLADDLEECLKNL